MELPERILPEAALEERVGLPEERGATEVPLEGRVELPEWPDLPFVERSTDGVEDLLLETLSVLPRFTLVVSICLVVTLGLSMSLRRTVVPEVFGRTVAPTPRPGRTVPLLFPD